jgi:hypothetical protein
MSEYGVKKENEKTNISHQSARKASVFLLERGRAIPASLSR